MFAFVQGSAAGFSKPGNVMTSATDIVVRRCTVRVVRHGGWSWGPQPQRLVDQVLAALPGLIAERLGDLAPDGAPDVEITEPVRIAVSLRWLTCCPAGSIRSGMSPWPRSRFRNRPGSGTRVGNRHVRPATPPPWGHTPAISAHDQPATLMQFLAGLFERGELDQFLALLPVDTLEAWYQSLAASGRSASLACSGRRYPGLGTRSSSGGTRHLATDVPAQPPEAGGFPETQTGSGNSGTPSAPSPRGQSARRSRAPPAR